MPAARESTLVMLAVSVGAGSAAMTGGFVAMTDDGSTSSPTLAAGTVASEQALVRVAARDAVATVAVPAAMTAAHSAPEKTRAAPRLAETAAAVSAEDTHQMNAREIAALARSVDLQRAAVAQPAGLPVSGVLDAEPGAVQRTTALSAAMSKVGVPYVWGAAGPRAFDCSGLVLWAFKKVGISLPHSSAAQSRMGRPVSKSQLRPGDLVFFYSPVSHVGIYLGGGKVVHASERGQPVKVSNMTRYPFHNARRL